MLRTKCTHCGKTVRAGDDWAGRVGNCPKCQGEITFPGTLADEWEHQPAHYNRPARLSLRLAPIVESFAIEIGCILLGVFGYVIARETMMGLSTGTSAGAIMDGFHRYTQPVRFWLSTSINLTLASLLILVGVSGAVALAKDCYALVPKRFGLKTFLIAALVGALLLWPISKIAVAAYDNAGNVLILLSAFAGGLCLFGMTWVEHVGGLFEFRGRWSVSRHGQPFLFFLVACLRYALAVALLAFAVWFYSFGLE
jgi:hypothetical protein